ncbi:unnamed protein product [Darwinula stevensoni]|uniref:K Homology domain-containing protein n=1 Tax=Darwinula stevensoni TaxID=69355 RepID=A0A7R8XFW9_9CRUS|nr:unnamed protein product [Darwinula stevensoni]CAG0889195.1 unnamed protein product [Darwinula stevensoni]
MRGQVLLMSSIPALAVLAYIFWRRKSRQYRTFSSKQVVDLSDKSLITVSGGNSTGEEKRSEEDSECHEASFSVCLELELRSSMANPREEEKEPSAAPQCISGSEEAQLSESMKEMHVSEDVGDENCLTKDQDTIPMNEEEGDLQEITSDGEVTSEVLDGRASRDSGVQPSCSSTPTSMIHSSPSPHVSHHISDTSSEVSSESERTVEIIKGESTPVKDHTSYDFELPQKYVGLLIGRLGCFVKEIRSSTGAVVEVRRHPSDNKFKICSVSVPQYPQLVPQGPGVFISAAKITIPAGFMIFLFLTDKKEGNTLTELNF